MSATLSNDSEEMVEHPFEAEDAPFRYVIGVDLGTTNSAAAYVDLGESAAKRRIRFFEPPQLVAPGEVAPHPILPSFLYLPGAYDLPPGSTALPWDPERSYAVGVFAREQGARVPGRLVASAKSWLSHAAVDRAAPILPWGAPKAVPKVSPVEASRRYLLHLREAWNYAVAGGRAGFRFEEQLVVLTVPASFDEVARELTLEAARQAGLPRVVLLEEPLAAFYAWLSAHEDDWQRAMSDGRLILVCDVGGGTTDFSIIGIRKGKRGLRFDRLAVGDHLLLGGDNMDHTLARHVETQMTGRPGKLDARRWHQLVHECRKAKEKLLGAPDVEAVEVTLTGEAGKLIGGTLKGTLTRDDVHRLLLEGFFPDVPPDAAPETSRRGGLTELGLPYEHDPAVTRHLTAFWRRFADYLKEETGREDVYPDFVLFNGGALAPAPLRERLRRIIGGWFREAAGEGWTPEALANPRPDLAVAAGAAYYGKVRLGEGVRVGSGSPRAYYVVVTPEDGTDDDAYTAVCLAPRGMEEGAEVRLDAPGFLARTNRPVAFQLLTSSTRLGDRPGDVMRLAPEEATVLPPIRTVLRYGKKGAVTELPVRLAVRLTEVGTLELWCLAEQTEHRWRLLFDVRREAAPEETGAALEATLDEALVERAVKVIRAVFEEGGDPAPLRRRLEAALELPRAEWPLPLLRKLADTLLAAPRDRSVAHEARWFNLLGYCLRPGFGDPMDELRMRRVWTLWLEGPKFAETAQCRFEWWVLWRRVAGGLTATRQEQIYHEVRPFLQPKVRTSKTHRFIPRRLEPRERMEMWMAMASLERLPADLKANLGRRLLEAYFRKGIAPHKMEWWSLSRIGARRPIYGPLDGVVPPAEVATWFKTIFNVRLERKEYVAHALVRLARRTGDRARDLPESVVNRIARWLTRLPGGAHFRERLLDPAGVDTREEAEWAFGEALPAGLVLASETA